MTDSLSQLSRLLGRGVVLAIAGRRYRLAPLRLSQLPALGRAMIAHGVSGQAAIDPSTPRHARKVEKSGVLTAKSVAQWAKSKAGTAAVLWLALRRRHPEITRTQAASLLAHALRYGWQSPVLRMVAGNGGRTDLSASEFADRAIDWRRLFHYLASRYGWSPQSIARLTLGQAVELAGDAPSGRVLLTRHELRLWRAERPAATIAESAAISAAADAAPTATCVDKPGRQARRPASFRRSLPEIFGPLTLASLARLAEGCDRTPGDRADVAPPHVEAPIHRDRGDKAFVAGDAWPHGVARRLEALLDALQGRAAEFPLSPPQWTSDVARFQ